jgi:hypothetical protein
MLYTVSFDEHFQAFKVKKRRDKFHMALSSDDLSNFNVYPSRTPSLCRKFFDHEFVVTKTEVSQLMCRDE